MEESREIINLHNKRMNIESMILSIMDDYLFGDIDKETVKEKALVLLLDYNYICREIMEECFGIKNEVKKIKLQ